MNATTGTPTPQRVDLTVLLHYPDGSVRADYDEPVRDWLQVEGQFLSDVELAQEFLSLSDALAIVRRATIDSDLFFLVDLYPTLRTVH
jgi:hypothetical protein